MMVGEVDTYLLRIVAHLVQDICRLRVIIPLIHGICLLRIVYPLVQDICLLGYISQVCINNSDSRKKEKILIISCMPRQEHDPST
jgi:hypothetical protein